MQHYQTSAGSMFKESNDSIYKNSYNGKEKRSIFGNDIPQVAKAKPDPKSSACCLVGVEDAKLPSGGFEMNAFYSTIWSHNLRSVLIKKAAFGEDPCCNNSID